MRQIVTVVSLMLALTGCGRLHLGHHRHHDAAVPPSLTGTEWQLVAIKQPHGHITPPSERDYLLSFREDGSIDGQFDCNRARGTYIASGRALAIGPVALTRAMCPPPDLGAKLAADLSRVASYGLHHGHLMLELNGHAGQYVFARVEK